MAYRNTLATEARKDARRRTILGAATGLFGSYGYHSTTVPMIVAESIARLAAFTRTSATRRTSLRRSSRLSPEGGRGHQPGQRLPTRPFVADSCRRRIAVPLPGRKPKDARILIVESSGLSPRLEQARRAILHQQAEQVCTRSNWPRMRSSLPTRPSPPVAWWAPSLSLFTVGWNKAQPTGRQLRKLREPWLITTPGHTALR